MIAHADDARYTSRRTVRAMADEDAVLIDRLQAGDEAAFADLVERYHARLLRLAEATVGSRAVAEEVVQDTWLAVVRGVERFEGRSTLRTWLFHILLNRARTAGRREQRAAHDDIATIESFTRRGGWVTPPEPWTDAADNRVVAEKVAGQVRGLLDQLPESQRQIVLLRDVEGVPPDEVSQLVGVTSGNQRVLLHRGRARLRRLLADEMGRG